METARGERKRATLYIVLIFLCGAIAGTVTTNIWKNFGPFGIAAQADSTPRSPRRTVEKFTKELNLTPEQAKQLNEILDETHAAYHEMETQENVIRQNGRARIREILTAEQRPKYEEILAKIEARRKQKRQ
jgi:Spy/CpxP family protein refolding chaperone